MIMEGTKGNTQSEPQQGPPSRSYGSVGRSNRLSSTIAQFELQSQASNNNPKRASPPTVKPNRQLPTPQKTNGNNNEKSTNVSETTNSSNPNADHQFRPKSRTIGPALAKQLSDNGEDKPSDIREIFANTEQDNNNNIDKNQSDSKKNIVEEEPKTTKIELRRSRGASESQAKRAAVFTTIRISKEKIDSQLSKPLPPPPQPGLAKSLSSAPSSLNAPKERVVKSSSDPLRSQTGELPKKPLPLPSKSPEFTPDTNVDIQTKKALPAPPPVARQVSTDDSSVNYQTTSHTLEKKGRKMSFRGSLDSRKEKDKEPPVEETPSAASPANPRERSKTLKRLITNKLFNKGEDQPNQTSPPKPETVSEPASPSIEAPSETPGTSSPRERTKSSRKLPQINKNAFKFLKANKKTMNSKLAEHLQNAEGEISAMFGSLMEEFEKMDVWTTRPHMDKNWNEVEQEESQVEPEIRCLLNIDKSKAEGFRFEFGRNFVVYTPVDKSGELIIDVEDAQKDIPYYLEFFADKSNPVPQLHYMNDGEEDKSVGPVVITIEAPPISGTNSISHMSFNSSVQAQDDDKRGIIRTKKGTERIFIPASQCAGKTSMIKHIKSMYPEISGIKLTKMPAFLQDSIEKKLVDFEKQSIIKRYKFGLLFTRDGQIDENEMFSNNEASPDYAEFLEWLGEKITLQGWSKYRGGLDVKTNTTGTHSIYTEHRGYEIMVVVLIFKEGDTPFDPLCLTTHFNHVFVVVQKETIFTNITHYRICVANKTGVPPYSPYLSSPAIYPKNDEFRDLLLTKLINGERAAMHAPDFRGKMIRTNKALLEEMAKEFIQRAKEKPKPEKSSEPAPSSSPPKHSSGLAVSANSSENSSSPPSKRASRTFSESPMIGEVS